MLLDFSIKIEDKTHRDLKEFYFQSIYMLVKVKQHFVEWVLYFLRNNCTTLQLLLKNCCAKIAKFYLKMNVTILNVVYSEIDLI